MFFFCRRFFFDPDYTDESAAAGNQSDLFGGAAGANNPGGLHANDYDDALLNFGDDDEAAAQELDDKALADLSMLTRKTAT